MNARSLARKAATVSAWTLLSRILGLVRDRTLAAYAGGSLLLDAFLSAFILPNLLRNLFGEGALSTAFIPRYAQLKQQDPAAAERFAGLVLTRVTAILSALALLGLAGCAAILVWGSHAAFSGGSGGGFGSQASEKAVLMAGLLVPMVPFLIYICLTAVLGGVLNVRRHFWVPAACPAILNLCLISTIAFGPENDLRLAPYAVLASGLLIAAASFIAVRATGGIPPLTWRIAEDLRPTWDDFRGAIGPSLLSAGVYQINSLLDSQIAYFLIGGGANQVLFFANRLLQFPMALIGHGVTTVAFPELARKVGEGWAAVAVDIRTAVRLQLFWLLPAAVGLVVCAEPLVRTIYQTGRFDEALVLRTVLVTQLLGLSLLPLSLTRLLVRVFHAARDQTTPMRISLALVGLNLASNLVLIQTPLREAGIALSTTLSGILGCGWYLWLLHRRGAHQLIDWRGSLRPLLASLVMAALVIGLLHGWPQPPGAGGRVAILRLAAAVGLGIASYLAIAGTGFLRRRTAGTPPAAA